jgi:hypothetical protein
LPTEVAKKNLGYFSLYVYCVLILTKVGWASLWAIFSQTHLVALIAVEPPIFLSMPELPNRFSLPAEKAS